MSTQKANAVTLTAAPGADLAQARFVAVGASGLAYPSAGADAVGVLLEAYDDSEFTADAESNAKPVAVEGIVEVQASAAIAVGANVASNATGQAAVATTGQSILGVCVKAAGGANEFANVLLVKAAGVAP